jgi:DNA excision repair protein ERCC-2
MTCRHFIDAASVGYDTRMKCITLGIREFALPVPRRGSIETLSGYGGASEGTEIHIRTQNDRSGKHADYRSEVPISAEFEKEGFLFCISGKIDGLFDSDPPRIEEIKSSFNLQELAKKLRKEPAHPYCLQLQTYGYFYFLKHEVIPKLSLHLVSSRTGLTEDLDLDFDLENYEGWLKCRLDELVQEARESEKRVARRKAIAAQFAFPFSEARLGQEDLMRKVEMGLAEKKRMFLQAPTGLGKTVGVLHPVIREALARGQRVIYITPKNSQHSVAEDAVDRFKESGAKVKSLTVTAKAKICFKNEPLCNPDYCEYAKDHYTKVARHGLKELLSKKRKLTSRVFRRIAEEYQVCPFELQLDNATEADVLICDYNYVFSPKSSFTQIAATSIGHEGKPSLVIDEAHNLFSRALGYYSPELSTATLERMRPAIQELPDRFRLTALSHLAECINAVKACAPKDVKNAVEIDPPSEIFLAQEAELRGFLARYLESDIEIQPRDPVLRLCFYWSEFTDVLGFITEPKRPEFFTVFKPDPTGGVVGIVCCDASRMLKKCYDEYEHVVGFSATLKPFDYYSKLSGLEPEAIQTAEFRSPFPVSQRKLLVIPEISTKYSQREKNYVKIAETIQKISSVKPGNYFAFFPSFEFLEQVLVRFICPEGFGVLRQNRDMKSSDANAIIDHLKTSNTSTIVFAVQGGIFSEGVDYPGETVIGAFIVGPPLPPFDFVREKMRGYYEEKFGNGFDYTYTFPAMAKAVQAAGRVIRSQTDRGIIVLMDSRFLHKSYSCSMPADWFEKNPNELVSKSILRDVTEFWERETV